jgi:hypothetical protein
MTTKEFMTLPSNSDKTFFKSHVTAVETLNLLEKKGIENIKIYDYFMDFIYEGKIREAYRFLNDMYLDDETKGCIVGCFKNTNASIYIGI